METGSYGDGERGRLLRRAELTVHELDGEALVLDAGAGDTHRLNETALFIWRQCDGRRDAPQVTERLIEAYNVSPDVACQHVERVVRELRERHLVVTAE